MLYRSWTWDARACALARTCTHRSLGESVGELRTAFVTVGYSAWVSDSPSWDDAVGLPGDEPTRAPSMLRGEGRLLRSVTAGKGDRVLFDAHPQSVHRMSTFATQSPVVIHTLWRLSSPECPYGVAGESDTAV